MKKILTKYKKELQLWSWIFILSVLTTITLITLTERSLFQTLKIVLGFTYFLFLPGYIISFLLFKYKEIKTPERIALSFALSISIIPLITTYLNLFLSIKITAFTITLLILAICSATLTYKNKNQIISLFSS